MSAEEVENLCDDMETLMDCDDEYIVRGDLKMKRVYDMGEIEMSFMQVWCLFGMPEGVIKKRYYEYRIDGPRSNFIIYSVGVKFMGVRRWRVLSDTSCEKTNGLFMRHLERGLRCFDEYYSSMERGVYESSDREVEGVMKELRKSMEENMSRLKRM